MKEQKYWCEKCGVKSHVLHHDRAGVMEVVHLLEDDHKKQSPECNVPVAMLRVEEIDMNVLKYVPKCIYCGKTFQESGRTMFSVRAPGTYYQCFPILCDENKEKIFPDGSKRETRAGEAGENLAKAVIEMVNLMYQNKTALRFLFALCHEVSREIDRRK